MFGTKKARTISIDPIEESRMEERLMQVSPNWPLSLEDGMVLYQAYNAILTQEDKHATYRAKKESEEK